MTKYEAKSVIVGRMKRKDKEVDLYPCFVSLFDVNDAHRVGEVPKEILNFEDVFRLDINLCPIKYMLPGNDIVINDLEYVEIGEKDDKDGKIITITGKKV